MREKFGKRAARAFAFALMAVLAAGLVAGCGARGSGGGGEQGGGGEGQQLKFRLAETHPEDYPTTLADEEFAKLVGERSDGRITVDVFPSAQLGEEAAVLEQVQLGAIEFTRTSASPLAEFSKPMGVFNLPYIFESEEHKWKFLESEEGQALLDSLEEARMHGLAYYDSGARNFYTKEEVRTPEDMKGLKIRVQKSEINVALMKALGASATPMDFGEVYSALQTGVIDGAENNWPSYESTSHYEVANNYTINEHTRVPEVLLASQQTWDSLSPEDQELIQKAAQDSVAVQRREWDKAVEEARQAVTKEDANIIEVQDLSPWQEKVQPLIDDYRDEYGETLDAIEAAK
jgi:tripartite ATP-independent transporter DctP family solute receptor